MTHQTPFKRWSDFLKRNSINQTPTTNRFIARFKLALKFKSIDAEGYTDKTLSGYSALLSVFLAYTAFEAFLEALSENSSRSDHCLDVEFSVDKHNHPFNDLHVAERIWSNEKLHQILIDYADVSTRSSFQMESLMSFYLGDIDGVHLHSVARQIRHLVAHGHMTAYGSESIRRENTEALFDLSRLILAETRSLFDQYVSKLEAKYSD